MPKPKSSKPKRKAPSKNHFKAGDSDAVTPIGTLKGVAVDIDQVREGASDIKLVGQKRPKSYGGGSETVEGEELKVFTTEKAIFFVPPCGDQGYGITRETFDAMVKAVKETDES